MYEPRTPHNIQFELVILKFILREFCTDFPVLLETNFA